MRIVVATATRDTAVAWAAAQPHFDHDSGCDIGCDVGVVWAGDPHLRPVLALDKWGDLALECPDAAGWNRGRLAIGTFRYAVARGLTALATNSDIATGSSSKAKIKAEAWLVIEPSGNRAQIIAALARPSPNGHAGLSADSIGVYGDVAQPSVLAITDITAALALAVETLVQPIHIPFTAVASAANVRLSPIDDPQFPSWNPTIETQPRLANGACFDNPMMAVHTAALRQWRAGERELPPDPFSDPRRFFELLESPPASYRADIGWYWQVIRDARPDLIAAFPDIDTAATAARFARWAETSWSYDNRTPQLRAPTNTTRPPWSTVEQPAAGINLIGYHRFENSTGNVVRRVAQAFNAAAVPHAALHYNRSGSPAMRNPPATTTELRYDTNLVILNGDQMPYLAGDYGPELYAGRYTIGYWFWDVEYVPPSLIANLDYIDELWTATEWTAAAFKNVTALPVKVAYVPVPAPPSSGATRRQLGLPTDDFLFLITFDYHSLAERKNPFGAVEAYRRAFPTPGAAQLHVKTLNAALRPDDHRRLLALVDGRPDITVHDRQLDYPDQIALIGAADCLLSLHRSEGFGIHLMEAMWMNTPTITTRYSANLSFQNDKNAALVDYELIGVNDATGYFPPQAVWAEPDLDHAARLITRMVSDPAWYRSLQTAGRQTAQNQPTLRQTGEHLAALAARPDRAEPTVLARSSPASRTVTTTSPVT